uniref:NADH-ubiquinone oxidoreductase chain 2 n=1 Tax=Gryllotalpa orientalis TaxID=213494 RepID=Q5ISF6_GRYOR|nr:NADH dehydrogenase subunit 2 [Gryllotalpa orientalis]AAT64919.1 NADH dehydrogenase subunit 2 [Gryllotalpa orientalis]
MFLNPAKLFFLTSLMLSTLIVMSSSSWFSAWIALEINLLSFIPLISNTSNVLSSEAALKYFLTQAMASAVLLLFILFNQMSINFMPFMTNPHYCNLLLSSPLLLKLGAAPFHFWFPSIMEGLDWFSCFILMTWQKIAPMIILFNILTMVSFFLMVMTSSVMVGSWGGLNQISLRKLMAYSSITHIGWMLAAMAYNINILVSLSSYMLYPNSSNNSCLLEKKSFPILKQMFFSSLNPTFSIIMFSGILSLGGLPPFLGFLPKWLVIQSLTYENPFLITMMVILTLMTLFFYMRLSFTAFLMFYPSNKWFIEWSNSAMLLIISSTIIFLLPVISIIPFNL